MGWGVGRGGVTADVVKVKLMSTDCQSTVGQMLVNCWLTVFSIVITICWPTVVGGPGELFFTFT